MWNRTLFLHLMASFLATIPISDAQHRKFNNPFLLHAKNPDKSYLKLRGDDYQFAYRVGGPNSSKSNGAANFAQSESKEDGVVVGLYELTQPDGRHRVVTYRADDQNGFVANVSYSQPGGSGYVYRVHNNPARKKTPINIDNHSSQSHLHATIDIGEPLVEILYNVSPPFQVNYNVGPNLGREQTPEGSGYIITGASLKSPSGSIHDPNQPSVFTGHNNPQVPATQSHTADQPNHSHTFPEEISLARGGSSHRIPNIQTVPTYLGSQQNRPLEVYGPSVTNSEADYRKYRVSLLPFVAHESIYQTPVIDIGTPLAPETNYGMPLVQPIKAGTGYGVPPGPTGIDYHPLVQAGEQEVPYGQPGHQVTTDRPRSKPGPPYTGILERPHQAHLFQTTYDSYVHHPIHGRPHVHYRPQNKHKNIPRGHFQNVNQTKSSSNQEEKLDNEIQSISSNKLRRNYNNEHEKKEKHHYHKEQLKFGHNKYKYQVYKNTHTTTITPETTTLQDEVNTTTPEPTTTVVSSTRPSSTPAEATTEIVTTTVLATTEILTTLPTTTEAVSTGLPITTESMTMGSTALPTTNRPSTSIPSTLQLTTPASTAETTSTTDAVTSTTLSPITTESTNQVETTTALITSTDDSTSPDTTTDPMSNTLSTTQEILTTSQGTDLPSTTAQDTTTQAPEETTFGTESIIIFPSDVDNNEVEVLDNLNIELTNAARLTDKAEVTDAARVDGLMASLRLASTEEAISDILQNNVGMVKRLLIENVRQESLEESEEEESRNRVTRMLQGIEDELLDYFHDMNNQMQSLDQLVHEQEVVTQTPPSFPNVHSLASIFSETLSTAKTDEEDLATNTGEEHEMTIRIIVETPGQAEFEDRSKEASRNPDRLKRLVVMKRPTRPIKPKREEKEGKSTSSATHRETSS